MLFAIDIGNSNLVLGLYNDQKWFYQWRLETSLHKNSNDYAMDVSSFFLENNIDLDQVNYIVLSSVVPGLTNIIQQMLVGLFDKKPLIVGPDIYPKLKVDIERPHEIGSDLVANAVAAFEKFKDNCIVVDFGTALTFTTISKEGKILGVAIAPGLKTAISSLFHNTAQLPEVPLELPDSAIGRNTAQAIQAGVILGYVGLVESLLNRIQQELNVRCKIVATGGLSVILEPVKHLFTEIDRDLTLNGLMIISEYHRGLIQ